MKFKNIKNARWANAEQTVIDCKVDIEINGVFETVPFTASANDTEKHGREIFDQASKGIVKDYYLDPAIKKQTRIVELKQLLRDTDHVALPDYDKEKHAVLINRQKWREEIRQLKSELV